MTGARLLTISSFLLGCSSKPIPIALSEPIHVKDAQFVQGPLPGKRAPAGTNATSLEKPLLFGATLDPPGAVPNGEVGVKASGTASPETVAVAVALKGTGSGYWLLPSQEPDPTNDLKVNWSMVIDFSPDAPTGNQHLLFAAVDASGRSGTQLDLTRCILPPIRDYVGDNFLHNNACAPSFKPPATVLAVSWDTPVDLDLELVTPEGVLVDSKHPTTVTANPDGGAAPSPPNVGKFLADANANCIPSGGNFEQIYWDEQPAAGLYHVYVNLFDACGQSDVHFTVSLWVIQAGDAGNTWKQVETSRTTGSLVAADANGGAHIGTFVTDFQVQ